MSAMLPLAYSIVLFLSGSVCGFFVWVWYRNTDDNTPADYQRHSQKLRETVKQEQEHSASLQRELTQRITQLQTVDQLNHQMAKKLKQTQSLFLNRDLAMKTATQRSDVTLKLLDEERTAKNQLQEELDLARQQLSSVQTELELIKRRKQRESGMQYPIDTGKTFAKENDSASKANADPLVLRVVFDDSEVGDAKTERFSGKHVDVHSDSSSKPIEDAFIDPVLGKIFRSRPAQVDDLKEIAGIAEMLEAKLHEQGIYRFEQIMNWDEKAVVAFSELLDTFKDRVERNNWVAQARYLYQQQNKAGTSDSPAA